MPKRSRKKSARKRRSRRRALKRPYKLDKKSRALRRFRKRRHRASKVHGHHKRFFDEAETTNYLLHQILKTAASTDADPYHYEPRHYSRDPEYKFETDRMKEFKRGVPAPDVHFWRPQGKGAPPHLGNYPRTAAPARRRPAASGSFGRLTGRFR